MACYESVLVSIGLDLAKKILIAESTQCCRRGGGVFPVQTFFLCDHERKCPVLPVEYTVKLLGTLATCGRVVPTSGEGGNFPSTGGDNDATPSFSREHLHSPPPPSPKYSLPIPHLVKKLSIFL